MAHRGGEAPAGAQYRSRRRQQEEESPLVGWSAQGPPRVDDERDLFLLRDGSIRPHVLDAHAGEGHWREGQLHDRPTECHPVPGSSLHHDLVWTECR